MSKLSTRTRKCYSVNGRMCAGFLAAFCFFCCDGFPNTAQLGCGFPNPWNPQGLRCVKPRLMQSSSIFFQIENTDTQLHGATNPTRRGIPKFKSCAIMSPCRGHCHYCGFEVFAELFNMNIPNPPNLAKFNLRGVPMLSWGTHFG